MAEYTSFGLVVKTKLLGPPTRTQAWLAREITMKTGLIVDDAYLSKILTGQRSAPKIVQAIREILDLPEQSQHTTDAAQTFEQSENDAQQEVS